MPILHRSRSHSISTRTLDVSHAHRSLAKAEERRAAPSEQHGGIFRDDETPVDIIPCQCTRTHGSGPCEGGTDHPSRLCQWCREDGTPDGKQCNCLCASCAPAQGTPPPSPPSSTPAYASLATPGTPPESICDLLTSACEYLTQQVCQWMSTKVRVQTPFPSTVAHAGVAYGQLYEGDSSVPSQRVQQATASSLSLASVLSREARRAPPPLTQPKPPPPPTLPIEAFACSWSDSNSSAGQTPSLNGTSPRPTPPRAAQTTTPPHTDVAWLVDGLQAQLSIPQRQANPPSKTDPFGLGGDPNPSWLPGTTLMPPSPPPSSSEFDGHVYFHPEIQADDLPEVHSV